MVWPPNEDEWENDGKDILESDWCSECKRMTSCEKEPGLVLLKNVRINPDQLPLFKK